jgi:hypothetical protein
VCANAAPGVYRLKHDQTIASCLNKSYSYCAPGRAPGHLRESARAGNRRFRRLSDLRAHTKAPYKTDLHRKTLMVLNPPGTARTVQRPRALEQLDLPPAEVEVHVCRRGAAPRQGGRAAAASLCEAPLGLA